MVEIVVKVIDLTGNESKYVQTILRIFNRNPIRTMADPLFYIFELNRAKKDFLDVHWAQGIHWAG